MKGKIYWLNWTLFLTLLFPLNLSGCADTDGINNNQTPSYSDTDLGRGEEQADSGGNRLPDGGTSEIGAPYLVLLSQPEETLSYTEQAQIQVLFLDGTDEPVSDSFITFTPLEDTLDTRLTASNAVTDVTGVAEIAIEAGVQAVEFDVEVAVFDNQNVEPVYVHIVIQPKDQSDYLIRLSYDGPISLAEADVTLYAEDVSCDELVAHWDDPPSELTGVIELTLTPDASGQFLDQELNVPRDLVFRHAVARGKAINEAGTDSIDYYVVYGCTDEIPDPDITTTNILEIQLDNLWPEIEGTYEISNELNLIDAIPGEAQPIVEAIFDVFAHPGLGVLKLIAISSYEIGGTEYDSTGTPLEYWEVDPWYLFLEYDADDDVVVATTLGSVLVALLDSAVEEALSISGDFGAGVQTFADVMNHLFDNLEHFSLHGNLVITQEADMDGYLGDENELRFNKITLTWMEGGLSGDDVDYDFIIDDGAIIDSTQVAASVLFHPSMEETYSLEVAPFDLSLHYGELIFWLIENVVFPRVFGEEITSLEAFVDSVINCSTLSERMNCEGEFDTTDCNDSAGWLGDAAEAACFALAEVASTAVEELIADLTTDVSNYFTMYTPDYNPCYLGFNESGDSFIVERLGDSTWGEECEWVGEIRYDLDDTDYEYLEGFWWGDRL